jgi:hypothetical protein
MMTRKVVLSALADRYAVCRLDPGAEVPELGRSDRLLSITRTDEELSIVCREELAPAAARCERGWRCLKVEGPLDFSEVGIVASLAGPLTVAGISIFVVSTYETDYLLIKDDKLAAATRILAQAGHTVKTGGGGRASSV